MGGDTAIPLRPDELGREGGGDEKVEVIVVKSS